MPANVRGSDSLYWKTGLDLNGLRSGVAGAKGILAGFAKSVSAIDIFAGVAIGGVMAFQKITDAAVEFSQKFEHKMKEVETISNAVKANFAGISDEVMDLSTQVPDTAIQLTEALYQIVSAGYDGAEAMDVLRTSSELAVATVTDTKTAADAITSVMNAYGQEAGTAAEISDKFAITIQNAKTTMEELGPQLTMVTGLAAQAGMSFDDLMATVAQGAKTLKTPQMMTGIRGIIRAIISPSKEAQEVMEKLELQFDSTTLKTEGLAKMLDNLMEATDGNIETLGKLFPNVQGLAGLLSILTDRGAAYKEQLENIRNASGTTNKWFNIMMDDTENLGKVFSNLLTKRMKPLGDFFLNLKNNALRGLNAELRKTGNVYQDTAIQWEQTLRTMQKHREMIAGLINTVDELGQKQNLTTEESYRLESAQASLTAMMPEYAEAVHQGADAVDRLRIAQLELKELDDTILEQQKEIIEYKKRAVELDQEMMKVEEDDHSKKIKRLEDELSKRKEVLTRAAEEFVKYRNRVGNADDPFGFLGEGIQTQLSEPSTIVQSSPDFVGDDYYWELIRSEFQLTKDQMAELVKSGKSIQDIVDELGQRDEEYLETQIKLNNNIGERAIKSQQLAIKLKKLRNEEEMLNKVGGPAPTGKKPTATPTRPRPATAPDEETLEALDQWIEKNRTAEEQIAFIHEKYAKLRSATTSEELRKRISEDEEYQIKKIQLAEEEKETLNEINTETLEQFKQSLEQQISEAKDNTKIREMLEEKLLDVKKQLKKQENKAHREMLDDILMDTQKMNIQELENYKKHLRRKILLFRHNSAQQQAIANELADVIEEIYRRQREEIRQFAQGFEAVGIYIEKMDKDLGGVLRQMASIADHAIDFKEALDVVNVGDAMISAVNIAVELGELLAGTSQQAITISEIYDNMVRRQAQLVQMSRGVMQIEAMRQQIELLKQQQEFYQREIEFYEERMRDLEGTQFSDDAVKQLEDAKNALSDIELELYNIREQIQNALTGTNINAVADELVTMFEQGKTAAEDFATTFEELMKKSMLSIFKQRLLNDQLEDWYDDFSEYMESRTQDSYRGIDDIFQEWKLRTGWKGIINNAREQWDMMQDFLESMGVDIGEGFEEKPEGLAGAIQNIREETANILAGQMGGIRYDVAESKVRIRTIDENIFLIRDNVNLGVTHLEGINNHLLDISKTNKQIARNTKKLDVISRNLR